MAIAIPPSDMMLAVIPSARKGRNAIRIATGMVTIGMMALGTCARNSRITSATVITTSIKVVRRLPIARRISSERS